MAGDFVVISVHDEELQRVLHLLGAEARPAIVRSVNRTATGVEVFVARRLAEETGIKVGVIRGEGFIRVTRATAESPTGAVEITGKRIPLFDLRARRAPGGVAYTLPGSPRSFVPGAFLATVRSASQFRAGGAGHQGVFGRRFEGGKRVARLPIVELFGPSFPHVTRQKVLADAEALGRERLQRELEHEIDRLLSGSGRAA